RPLAALAPRYLPSTPLAPGPPSLDELTHKEERQANLFAPGRAPGAPRGAISVITGGGTLAGGTGATGPAGALRLVPRADGEAETGAAGGAAAEAPPSTRLPDLWQLHDTYILAPIAG